MTRRFGFECELSSGAGNVIAALHDDGLAPMDYLHDYHCGCDECDHEDVGDSNVPLFIGQEDCTVDGEIITQILTYGSDNAERAFDMLGNTLLRQRAKVDDNAGFHVHVDKRDLDHAARLRLLRMFVRYQDTTLAELASAKFNYVRGYNSPVSDYATQNNNPRPVLYPDCNGRRDYDCCRYCREDSIAIRQSQERWDVMYAGNRPLDFWKDNEFVPTWPSKGSWLKADYGDTFEFRLWNATRVPWRMRLHVGISVAMVNAAKDGVNVSKDDPRPLEAVLFDHLDDSTWASLLRQRSFKDE